MISVEIPNMDFHDEVEALRWFVDHDIQFYHSTKKPDQPGRWVYSRPYLKADCHSSGVLYQFCDELRDDAMLFRLTFG